MEVIIDWSSCCGLYSDTRKEVQQVVSEPSVLGEERRQQFAAQLEEIIENSLRELQREQRAHWQEFKAELKAEFGEWKKIYQDLCLANEDPETADANSGICESQVREEDLKSEARQQQSEERQQQSEARFAMADTESSNELREKGNTITEPWFRKQVSPIRDYQPFNPLPQVEGLEFDNLELHNGGLEVQQAKATMDPDSDSHKSHEEGEPPPISSTTLVQIEGGLGKQKEEEVSNIDLQLCILSSYQNSTSYLVLEILDVELEGIVLPPRFKGEECVAVVFKCSDYLPFPDSQQLQKVGSLPTARQNASVRKLAMNLPISAYYCVSLSWLLIWDPKPMVKMKLMAHHGEVVEEELESMGFPIYKKFKEAKFLAIVLKNAMMRKLVITLIVVREVRLSVWNPKAMVKMKYRAVLIARWISDIDLSGRVVIESLRHLNGDEDGFDFLDYFSRFSLNCISLGLLWSGTNMLAASSLAASSVSGKGYISKEIGIGPPRIGIDHIDGLVKQPCSVVEEEQYCCASSLGMSKKRFEVADVINTKFLNKKTWLQRLKKDKRRNGWMSIVYFFDGYEVVMRHDPCEVFGRGNDENGKEVMSSNELFEFEQLRKKEEKEDWEGRLSIHQMPYGSLEATRNEEFSSMMLMLLADQKRYDTLWMSEVSVKKTCQPSCIVWWVSNWFPKPTVKMKNERLSSGIPCGQGILWGMDCCDHKLMRGSNATSATCYEQL